MANENVERSRRTIEQKFWDRHQDQRGISSQYEPLFEALILKIRSFADSEKLDPSEYEAKLHQAAGVVEGIAYALKAYWKDPPEYAFWYGFDNIHLIEQPEEWTDVSPISPRQLDAAAAKYLDRPWMQLDKLDWYLLNGFIVDDLLRLADGVKSGAVMGHINWAYVLSGGKSLNMIYWRLGLTAIKFATIWLLLPTLAALAYYSGYTKVAGWIIAVFGVLVTLRILFLPASIMKRRTRKREAAEWEDKHRLLFMIYQSSYASTINPTLLRERIIEAEKRDALVRPVVYSILDRAIARDPAVLTASD